MDNNSSADMASRIIATLDLMEFAIELQKQNIARRSPNLSEEKKSELLQKWINRSSLIKDTK